MRQFLPLITCIMGVQTLITTPGHAADCSASMIAPPPGQTLSVTALDANNACVTYLQQRSTAADLSAKIAEAERNARGEKAVDKSAHPAPPLPALTVHEVPTPASAPILPQTDSLYVDQHGASATLVFADGSTAEVTTGTVLPDGLKITAITRTGVFVRNTDGSPIRLNDATAGFSTPSPHTAGLTHPASTTPSSFGGMPGMP